MCKYCNPSSYPKFRAEYDDAVKMAMEHLDAAEIPADSVNRGLVRIHLACNINPFIKVALARSYPSSEALVN